MTNFNNGKELFYSVGKFLRRKLKENNMTQARLAEEFYIDERTMQRWINGEVRSLAIIIEVARHYDVSVQEVLFPDFSEQDYSEIAA